MKLRIVPPHVAAYLIATDRSHTTAEQAAYLGLKPNTVRGYRAMLYRSGQLTQKRYAPAGSAMRRKYRTVPEEAAAYLVRTHATHTTAQQAADLGVSLECIHKFRTTLYRAGRLSTTGRKSNRSWMPAELARAATLIRQGCTLTEAASALERTPRALAIALRRAGSSVAALVAERKQADTLYTARQVTRLMAVHMHTLRLWLRNGWLSARTGAEVTAPAEATRRGRPSKAARPQKRKATWLVTRADLIAFLQERGAWMTYTAEAIQDAELRRLATLYRSEARGRWWSRTELAAALYYSLGALNRWRRLYAWPAGVETVLVRGALYFWIRDGEPLPEPPEPQPITNAKPDRNAEMAKLYAGGMSRNEIARRFGVSRTRVYDILVRRRKAAA